MTSETLAWTGSRGGRLAEGRGLAGLGGSLVSMVLTSKAHRRRTPKISRRIPTIPTGCFDGWIVNVSAVDTGPRGSESGALGGARCLRHRSAPSRPTARGAGFTGQGVCVLHEGPTYVEYPRPSSSSTPPSCSASDDAGSHRSDRGSSPPTGRSAALPSGRRTQAVFRDVMTSETLRSHETTQRRRRPGCSPRQH